MDKQQRACHGVFNFYYSVCGCIYHSIYDMIGIHE